MALIMNFLITYLTRKYSRTLKALLRQFLTAMCLGNDEGMIGVDGRRVWPDGSDHHAEWDMHPAL